MEKPRSIDGWESVFRSGTDYEADLVRDRLDDSGIPAVVMTQRDHAFNLNVGDLAKVYVFVPEDRAKEARDVLSTQAISDDELTAIALASDPESPPDGDVPFDSGSENIKLSPPDDPS